MKPAQMACGQCSELVSALLTAASYALMGQLPPRMDVSALNPNNVIFQQLT